MWTPLTIMKKRQYFQEKPATQICIQNFPILNTGSTFLNYHTGQTVHLGAEFGPAGNQCVIQNLLSVLVAF